MSAQWVALMTTLAQVQSGLFIAYAVTLKRLRRATWYFKLVGALGAGTVFLSVTALFGDATGSGWPVWALYIVGTIGTLSCSGMVGGLIGVSLVEGRRPERHMIKPADTRSRNPRR